jgi:hypothetical protein
MCGPPLGCKRKMKMTMWSAQMYPALFAQEAQGLDGVRRAPVLPTLTALKGC